MRLSPAMAIEFAKTSRKSITGITAGFTFLFIITFPFSICSPFSGPLFGRRNHHTVGTPTITAIPNRKTCIKKPLSPKFFVYNRTYLLYACAFFVEF